MVAFPLMLHLLTLLPLLLIMKLDHRWAQRRTGYHKGPPHPHCCLSMVNVMAIMGVTLLAHPCHHQRSWKPSAACLMVCVSSFCSLLCALSLSLYVCVCVCVCVCEPPPLCCLCSFFLSLRSLDTVCLLGLIVVFCLHDACLLSICVSARMGACLLVVMVVVVVVFVPVAHLCGRPLH
jgi:hypothetical protein